MTACLLTVTELRAQALLLGMTYDPTDHTFYRRYRGTVVEMLDADTLEPLFKVNATRDDYAMDEWHVLLKREDAVTRGELGPRPDGLNTFGGYR